MPRIVIASASEVSRSQLSRLLSASGYDVYRLCASDGELRRTLSACEDGVVILAGAMGDGLPDDLEADFGQTFQFLLIGRPEVLAASESPRLFRLNYPCPGSAVLGSVEMLTQLHVMRLPKRSADERALVERAKAALMAREGIDEPEAHRRMQRHAMRHGIKMIEYAEMILQGSNDDV